MQLADLGRWQLQFTVDGAPVPKLRHRTARIRLKVRWLPKTILRNYTPKKTVDYEQQVALVARHAMRGAPPTDKPLSVVISLQMPVPASWSKKKKAAALAGTVLPTAKPDLSNVAKAIEDGMNGVVYLDDAQIVELQVRKCYGAPPCAAVHVSECQPVDISKKGS